MFVYLRNIELEYGVAQFTDIAVQSYVRTDKLLARNVVVGAQGLRPSR